MTLKSGIIRAGYWDQDVFYKYEDWYKLIKMFNSTPDVSQQTLKEWNKLGSFDVERLFLRKEISVDQKLPYSTLDLDLSISLYGKSAAPISGKFSGQYANGKPGFGRFYNQKTIIEGNFDKGLVRIINENQDRYIGPAVNGQPQGLGKYTFANGTVQDGYMDQGVYYQSKYLYDLVSVFSKDLKEPVTESPALQKWKSLEKFDLMKYIKNGRIKLAKEESPIEKRKVSPTETYIGQKAEKGKASIGINFSKTIKEGVFVNDLLSGFGRIVYEDQSWYIG